MSFTDVGIIFFKKVVILERNLNNLSTIANNAKQIIYAMDMHDSDYIMIFTTEITSIPNNLKKLWIKSYVHSYYIQTIYNDKEEIVNSIFITYVEPLLEYINHNSLVEEWKLNLDAE